VIAVIDGTYNFVTAILRCMLVLVKIGSQAAELISCILLMVSLSVSSNNEQIDGHRSSSIVAKVILTH
jgi:hypothetical protein